MKYIFEHRKLIRRLVVKEIQANYKNTFLGGFWLVATPLVMLALYTFVFGSTLKARWPGSSGSAYEYAITLYSGLVVFILFSDYITRAPGLIINNVNFVKKVIFPLEILPVVSLGSALFRFFISVMTLLIFFLFYYGDMHWTVLLIPVVLLPFVVLLLGLGLLLAALGVFVRDINQLVSASIMGFLLLCPIFFPLEAMPEAIRPFIYLNPLTFIVEQMREIVIWGRLPNWGGLLAYALAGFLAAWSGRFFFQKTRKGFADVL